MYLPRISPAAGTGTGTATTVRSVAVSGDVVNSRPPPPNSKLRLLCSYGGRITPRPNSKSLFYAGGETRVVAVDRLTTGSSLSSFTAHLSRSYNINRRFILKYLLPNEDLDSLISVTNDEDLENMIEEHDRLANFPQSSRIRLFLFPDQKIDLIGSEILDTKAESWFCDALMNTKITGLDSSDSLIEASRVEYSNNCSDLKQGFDLTSIPESIVLDTSSSFGSSSSSVSMSNLGLIGAHGEDTAVNLPEKKVKIPSQSSVESDVTSTTTALPFIQTTTIYQDQIPSNIIEQESCIIHDPPPPPFTGIYMPKHLHHLPPYHSPQPDHSQIHQELQYIQPLPHFIPQYPPNSQPISSFYPVYYSPIQQQPTLTYHPNSPYPFYPLPVKPTQKGNISMQYNTVDSLYPPRSSNDTPPPLDQNQPPLEPPVVDSISKPNCESGYEEEAYNLIYKTQPASPSLLAMYYEAGKASASKPLMKN
ncbi:uncharacterized protein LOC124919386 [Impatiens glandulifera]|uniref:uncharacterized protein LOC124919386 n=1 Tax=Impatiens glandulifera TaxID=253017 RepID=UPI001FB05A7B|nr:uncharacterized protein LOC124919386 [Impatiens glandulifera]